MNEVQSSSSFALKGVVILLGILLLGGLFLAHIFGVVVPPGMMGVRAISFGPFKGYSERALPPGYHWSVPLYSEIYLIPQTLQTYSFFNGSEDEQRSEENGAETTRSAALQISTKDRTKVIVDFSVLTRFFPAPGEFEGIKHGGPADLLRNQGVQRTSWDQRIVPVVSASLRQALGELATNDFYNFEKRRVAVTEARALMNRELAPNGIFVEALLLRRYVYDSEQLENAIYEKILQEQFREVNEQENELFGKRAELGKVEQEEDNRIAALRVAGQQESEAVLSEAALYEAKKRAEGDLLLAEARAAVDRQKAQALMALGGENFVAREMAPLVGALRGGVLSGVDPFDFEQWMARFGAAASETAVEKRPRAGGSAAGAVGGASAAYNAQASVVGGAR